MPLRDKAECRGESFDFTLTAVAWKNVNKPLNFVASPQNGMSKQQRHRHVGAAIPISRTIGDAEKR